MNERTLGLASVLPVRIISEDEAWLRHLPLPDASHDMPSATVTVRSGRTRRVPLPAGAELDTYWAEVCWSGPMEASFHVRGGEGLLKLASEGGAALELTVDPDDEPSFALDSALRLLLSVLLSLRGGFLVHASAVLVDGTAALFLGHSTAGKTTTARRLGREGAVRVADDLAVLWLGEGGVRCEVCRFDRAARLPGRVGAQWPLIVAYLLHKGSAETRGIPGGVSVKGWASALFTPPVRPTGGEQFLDALSRLARELPLRTFEAAPRGPLLPALRDDLSSLPPRTT